MACTNSIFPKHLLLITQLIFYFIDFHPSQQVNTLDFIVFLVNCSIFYLFLFRQLVFICFSFILLKIKLHPFVPWISFQSLALNHANVKLFKSTGNTQLVPQKNDFKIQNISAKSFYTHPFFIRMFCRFQPVHYSVIKQSVLKRNALTIFLI